MDNSPIPAPLMSNASTATAGTRTERPPVLGSTLLSGIVSRITPYWAWVYVAYVLVGVAVIVVVLVLALLFLCLQNLSLTTLSP